jgi:hypothetical protein
VYPALDVIELDKLPPMLTFERPGSLVLMRDAAMELLALEGAW